MLEARNLSFAYHANSPIFTRLSLRVKPAERVALSAPSGYGKTTLCRVLAGYEKPGSGEVIVDGMPLHDHGVCPVQLIGQHPELALDPRIRLKRSLEESPAVTPELLEALGIRKEWLSRYPHELSGGELQRICIARALGAHPSYLIADEITTMLDALTQAQVWHALLEWQELFSVGILFVSHSPALTERIATRLIDLTA